MSIVTVTPIDGWSPEQYERFRSERQQPFDDLLMLCHPVTGGRVVDLGCGTGDLTQIVHEEMEANQTVGIDSSDAMLARAQATHSQVPGLFFEQGDISTWLGEGLDLVFANASLQWVDDHLNLLARINLWTFSLPGLQSRPEDIEPNLQFELDQYAQKTGNHVTFSKEARKRFLDFALSPSAAWKGNFRDLNAAVARMATLALGGRISVEIVDEETQRLERSWADPHRAGEEDELRTLVGDDRFGEMDAFDRVQVAHVLDVCRRCRSLSEAGRQLFSASRGRKASTNDADRLRKYLNRFGIEWSQIS